MSCDIGLYGLAVMGQNFALNMASHGFKVAVGNRSPAKVDITVQRAEIEGDLPIYGAKSVAEFVAKLKKPRKVVILVQAGKPVDDTIAQLSTYMQPGDVIVWLGPEEDALEPTASSRVPIRRSFQPPSVSKRPGAPLALTGPGSSKSARRE